ncbi:MAG: nucleotidyltransferase domain-containing protein [Candidatus Bathyarchaeia archaeon]
MKLPEEIRSVLYRLVRNLSLQETISGIGLFGSWSRGDAEASSDVDLLIIDQRPFGYEYVERQEVKGLFIDFNYVPKKWIGEGVPPEIDQKLFETNVFYDRDWSLTSIRDWMQKSFRSPERLNIRTEAYIVEADIYLSRAASAQARNDFQSAHVFATLSLDVIFKILLESCKQPISQSRFISSLRECTEELEMNKLFENYVSFFQFFKANSQEAERKVNLFKSVWEIVADIVKNNSALMEQMHFKVKTKLKYYGSNEFMKGMTQRLKDMLRKGNYVEASHYIFPTLIEMLENYAWLNSAAEHAKLDYTTLFRSLRGLKKTPPLIYEKASELLQLHSIDEKTSEKTVKQAKEIILNIRQKRKQLIQA